VCMVVCREDLSSTVNVPMSSLKTVLLFALSAPIWLLLNGCGTYVPALQEFWEGTESPILTAGGVLQYKIKQKVYCSIVDAVAASRAEGLLPRGWAVQVTLDLQVDETSALNPGASLIKPLPRSQSFSLGLGGIASSQATREEKYGTYWNLDKLLGPTGNPCNPSAPPEHGSSLLIESHLGITEWLIDALANEYAIPASTVPKDTDNVFKQQSLSLHIKFIIITTGTVTPTWKLVRLASGNGSLPLASANRTRTHDLLVTFGPAFKAGTPNLAINSHAAQELGISVSNGNRIVNPTPGSQ
jgi:hypothetical protein